jgi:phosphate starvation-inducible protein PhoH and related proteins
MTTNTRDKSIVVPPDGQFLSSNPLNSKKTTLRSITLSKNRKMAKPVTQSRGARQYQPAEETATNVVKLGNRSYKRVELLPRNIAQETYVDALLEKRMVFAVGPAGTGKTLLAVLRAIKALREGEVTKIILTRPAVSVDEKHGFLPGDLNEKMAPWVLPIFDVFEEYYGLTESQKMLAEGVIEIAPLGFMRGRTFKNAYVIADEMQNATPDQTKMLLTRIGEGTNMVITLSNTIAALTKTALRTSLSVLQQIARTRWLYAHSAESTSSVIH